MDTAKTITVQAVVNAPIEKVWEYWTKPEHITKWAFASDDWEAPSAENDVRVGGKFKTRMQAKSKGQITNGEGQAGEGFDFTGTYTAVKECERIEYRMDDSRCVKIEFSETPEGVRVIETFDPESENPLEMQRAGWQSILENFKKYTEGSE